MNCPNCGTSLALRFKHVRMLTCDTCGSTVYMQDNAFRLAGDQGVMHDAPLLFGLGDTVSFDGASYQVIGHARFSYGPGWWDEFWVNDPKGKGAWISIDEGDLVLQYAVPEAKQPQFPSQRLGAKATYLKGEYTITEVDSARCVALRGALPEKMEVGETYRFVNATGPNGALLSGEFWAGGQAWFSGHWIDPFDVTVRR